MAPFLRAFEEAEKMNELFQKFNEGLLGRFK